MLSFFRKLFSDPTRDWPRSVDDPVLGTLRLSEEADSWDAALELGGRSWTFRITGEGTPDPSLVEHARKIVHRHREFAVEIAAFLEREAAGVSHLRPYATEIRQLEIEDIGLYRLPAQGMIYFRGPDPCRVWRCDYDDGALRDLGFDD